MLSFEKLNAIYKEHNEGKQDLKESAFKSKPISFWQELASLSTSGNVEGFAEILNLNPSQIKSFKKLINSTIEEHEHQSNLKRQFMYATGKNNGKK